LIEFGKEIREKELLDYHPCKLENESQKKKRKKILNNIIKNQNRLHTLHYLIRYAEKSVNGCLKKLIITDENGTLRTLLDRETIEQEIMNYNKRFFTQPTERKVYNDRIYKKLSEPAIYDKILAGTLSRYKCDDEDIYVFLKLLKKPQNIMNSYPNQITEEIFVAAVKRSKKQSASSIFSGRTYTVYKCVILNERIL